MLTQDLKSCFRCCQSLTFLQANKKGALPILTLCFPKTNYYFPLAHQKANPILFGFLEVNYYLEGNKLLKEQIFQPSTERISLSMSTSRLPDTESFWRWCLRPGAFPFMPTCLSVYMTGCLYICLSVCLSGCLTVRLSLSSRVSVCMMCVCLYLRLSECASVCLSVRLAGCLSVCLSVCQSVLLSICPSICMRLFGLYIPLFLLPLTPNPLPPPKRSWQLLARVPE